jgi:hypothetical protein
MEQAELEVQVRETEPEVEAEAAGAVRVVMPTRIHPAQGAAEEYLTLVMAGTNSTIAVVAVAQGAVAQRGGQRITAVTVVLGLSCLDIVTRLHLIFPQQQLSASQETHLLEGLLFLPRVSHCLQLAVRALLEF